MDMKARWIYQGVSPAEFDDMDHFETQELDRRMLEIRKQEAEFQIELVKAQVGARAH